MIRIELKRCKFSESGKRAPFFYLIEYTVCGVGVSRDFWNFWEAALFKNALTDQHLEPSVRPGWSQNRFGIWANPAGAIHRALTALHPPWQYKLYTKRRAAGAAAVAREVNVVQVNIGQ